nr:uncharacterized protein LOC110554226 [Meriones unguiculatus]
MSPSRGGAPSSGTAQKPVSALRRGDLLGTTREGAHESTHAGYRPEGAPVSPGCCRAGRKPESRPLLAWDSLRLPAPRPALPGLGVISVPTKETEARSWRWRLAPFLRAAPQEAGSCSPRRCPSLFEYPDEGGQFPDRGAPGAPWGVTPGKAIGAFGERENFVLLPGHGKCCLSLFLPPSARLSPARPRRALLLVTSVRGGAARNNPVRPQPGGEAAAAAPASRQTAARAPRRKPQPGGPSPGPGSISLQCPKINKYINKGKRSLGWRWGSPPSLLPPSAPALPLSLRKCYQTPPTRHAQPGRGAAAAARTRAPGGFPPLLLSLLFLLLRSGDFTGERPPRLRGSPHRPPCRALLRPLSPGPPGADSRPRGSRPRGWRPAGGGLEVRGWRAGERGAAGLGLSPVEEGLRKKKKKKKKEKDVFGVAQVSAKLSLGHRSLPGARAT